MFPEGRKGGMSGAIAGQTGSVGKTCHKVPVSLDFGVFAGHMQAMNEPFWKTTELEAMTPEQWESLCDGCGKCCMSKLEDEDTGDIYWTSVGCRLFDAGTCRCADYHNRLARVPDCVGLTPQNVRTISWLPQTCAYRLVAEGRDLYWWHPLISGNPETVHTAGMSMRGRVTALESELAEPEDFFEHMLAEEP
ncbi:hypothetical protein C7441_112110 [Pseudaminobacter salicylatoxidans]|uniref:UPF0260 protein C7441_112110 n=2 Tax=Pseudaminobacter salicylatoxidans TaxID=93369 RepID=A0A316CLC6_PSESE|nr:hypothetical protein C7441_112110 [Pseudaminobacter salicylatoxidans]